MDSPTPIAPSAPGSPWRRWLARLSEVIVAIDASPGEVQDNRIARLEHEIAVLRAQLPPQR